MLLQINHSFSSRRSPSTRRIGALPFDCSIDLRLERREHEHPGRVRRQVEGHLIRELGVQRLVLPQTKQHRQQRNTMVRIMEEPGGSLR